MDKLSKSARRRMEFQGERKAFGDATAMSQALARAIARQPNVSANPIESHHGPHTTAEAT